MSQYILQEADIKVDAAIIPNRNGNRMNLAEITVAATTKASLEEIWFSFDKKTFPKLVEEDGGLAAGSDEDPCLVSIEIKFELCAAMAKGKTNYAEPPTVKKTAIKIEVVALPFVVTKGKHPKVYKAVLKYMTKDVLDGINSKIAEVVAGAIHIINEKLVLVTRNIGVAAKERAGATWGIADDELAKIRETFDKYDADGSGELDFAEVRAFCEELGVMFTDEELMEALDDMEAISGANKNGQVDIEEFVSWWTSEKNTKASGSVAARLAEGRDKIFKQEMAANSPMGRLLLARAGQ